MITFALAALSIGCAHSPALRADPVQDAIPEAPASWATTEEGKHVLVLWNRPHPQGEKLALYYAWKRGVPRENVLRVIVDAGEDTNIDAFKQGIAPQVREKSKASKTPIDYVVLTKGMPLRIFDEGQGYSLDGYIAAMDIEPPAQTPPPKGPRQIQNRYFNRNEPFSRAKYGFYLVTRLDGYTFSDAKRLVDNSLAAKGDKGPYFIDCVPTVANDGYGRMNATMVEAGKVLQAKGIDVTVDRSADFILPSQPLMGYCSWGSNDQHFVAANYLGVRFKPGALAETFVSTSARTMSPVSSGQSVITDLIKNGVTGVKGYVLEPYTAALARPNILFDRYTSGYNLAESFYMASPLLKWRDVVFGDPLCRPYRK